MAKSTPKTQMCSLELKRGVHPNKARKPFSKFSLVNGQEGVYHKICKECRTKLSKEWTTARADYRKEYQKARMINLQAGKEVVRVPDAKTFRSGDVLRYKSNNMIYRPKASTVKRGRPANVPTTLDAVAA